MFQKIIHFIKYHNAIPIALSLISIVSVSAFAASPEVRDAFVSSQEMFRSVDNSGIILADLDNFNFELQIKGITEDVKNYYISYNYKTLSVNDYFWQEVQKGNVLTISKEGLSGRDLGLYIADQLGEVIDSELSYLQEVKNIEQEKGITQKIATVQYAGLIGQFLNTKEKVFPGYQPVVVISSEPPKEIALQTGVFSENATGTKEESFSKRMIRKMVEDILAQKEIDLGDQALILAATTTAVEVVVVDPIIEVIIPTSTTTEEQSTTTESVVEEIATTTPEIITPVEETTTTTEAIIIDPPVEEPLIEEPPVESATTTEQ